MLRRAAPYENASWVAFDAKALRGCLTRLGSGGWVNPFLWSSDWLFGFGKLPKDAEILRVLRYWRRATNRLRNIQKFSRLRIFWTS